MKFSEWLKMQETGTSTANVAHVPTKLFGGGQIFRRIFANIKKFGLAGPIHTMRFSEKKQRG